jgi:RimJ/RimL family protein N-acetyltransferase
MIVTDDRVALFVAERCHVAIVPPFTCMGIERNGEVVAGVVFNSFTWTNIHVTVAGTGFTRPFIRAVGLYVFGQLECLRMTITTEQPKVIEYAKRLGAQTEGRIRNHFGQGRDGIVLGILREEWKFR